MQMLGILTKQKNVFKYENRRERKWEDRINLLIVEQIKHGSKDTRENQ